MLNRALLGVSVVVAAGLLVGCNSGGGSGGGFSERERAAKTVTGVFRYPIVTNPSTLDPARVEDGDTIDLLQQVYEGLVAWGPDNTVIGILADSWTIEDGGTTVRFNLKKGVKFHNGQEMTSADVKWSIERACRKEIQSPVAEAYMGDIVGVKEMVAGKATEVSGITTPDPHTVVIKLDKPRPYWVGKFTYLCSAVLPKGAVPIDGEIKDIKDAIGTGPFKFSAFTPEQVVKLEGFKDYHGGAPKLTAIERRVVKDPATRLSMYKTGEIDLVMLERQDVAGLQADPKLKDQLQFFDRPAIWYLGLNQVAYPAFKDKRLRQAIAMAVDRETIVKELLGGINTPATSFIPPGVPGHRPDAPALKFDPAKAKQLLAEAGYGPGGKELPPLELNYREARKDIDIVAVAVASQLEKNLGVKPKLVTQEWRKYLEARNRKEHPFFHMRWAADYLDPENFITFFFATYGPENKIGYSNPALDALTSKADVMPDGPDRIKLYQQAEDIALDDAAMIPIYFQRDAELISPRVKGLRESIFGHLPHTTVTTD